MLWLAKGEVLKKFGDYVYWQAAIIIVLIALIPTHASADRVERLIASSEKGDTWSDYELGMMYRSGDGVEPDMEKAIYHLRRASPHVRIATFELAMMLKYGEGVPADLAEARQLLESSEFNFKALYELGHMYEQGLGVPSDYAKAVRLYCRAAVFYDENYLNSGPYGYVPPNPKFVPGEDYDDFLNSTCGQDISVQRALLDKN